MRYSLSLQTVVALFFIFSSCSKVVTTEELEHYLADPDNGLVHKQRINDISIEVAYRPATLIELDEPRNNNSVLQQYYLLSISRNDKEILDPTRGFSTYSSLLQTLAFHPQEYIRLTSARGDTLVPSNSILERTYGLSTSTRVLIAFPAKSDTQDVLFHLSEFGLHTGNLSFPFLQEDIATVPKLKTGALSGPNP